MLITKNEKRREFKKIIFISFVIGIFSSSIFLFFKRNILWSTLVFFAVFASSAIYFYVRKILKNYSRINKMEDAFPDFLQLMSSNLRAGMTVDRAILLSSRPEFSPLDQEILRIGKDLTTGKNIEESLLDMSDRINSERIHKIILLIISGISSGGDMAILLEQTAVSIREKGFVEKKAASSVLMYVIFIFLAVSIFAPALFSLSVVLVEVLTNILSGLPNLEANINLPFTLSKVNISVSFIKYFSIIFMIFIDFFSSITIGLVSKGEERDGIKYFPIILLLSFIIFFSSRIVISKFLVGLL